METHPISRFVVLHHTGYAEDHFDLMIEPVPDAEKLLTWRVDVWPLVEGVTLVPLGEHRRDYLDYEGPVPGNRGHVRRVAGGVCAVQHLAGGNLRVVFDDAALGSWELVAGAHTARRPG